MTLSTWFFKIEKVTETFKVGKLVVSIQNNIRKVFCNIDTVLVNKKYILTVGNLHRYIIMTESLVLRQSFGLK